jgi:uncharacterized protein YjbI with pentapeptide repeats
MHFIERFSRWEGIVFGFIIGVAATVVASMAYNEIAGTLRVSHLKRSLHNNQLEEFAAILEQELATASTAMKDGRPLQISNYLAFHFMPKLYAHHMDYATTLLKKEDVATFNSLRDTTHFLTFNLSQRDFAGLDLRSVNLAGTLLTGTDFSEANLEGADFRLAEMPRANLKNAKVSRAAFGEAILSNAILTGIHGEETHFEKAVLVGASLIRLDDLRFADFSGAELDQANLFDSRFFDASFDRADFTLVSAVGSDFAVVHSMDDVNFTGANLTGARIEPGRAERAWFVNADGLSARTTQDLRRHGGIARPEEVLEKVDPRIVAGFRAQIEEDESIPPGDRERVLLEMLQEYYLN